MQENDLKVYRSISDYIEYTKCTQRDSSCLNTESFIVYMYVSDFILQEPKYPSTNDHFYI